MVNWSGQSSKAECCNDQSLSAATAGKGFEGQVNEAVLNTSNAGRLPVPHETSNTKE